MSELQAGREMDARIAVEAMGWTPRGEHPIFGTPMFATGQGDALLPHFSTHISAAWSVGERMRELGYHFLLLVSADSGLAVASFYLGPHDRRDLSATENAGESPLAICRAALKALEAPRG